MNVIDFILGQVADVDTASSSDALGSRFKHRSVFKYGFFSPKPKGSTELGAPLWTFELSEGDGGDSQKEKKRLLSEAKIPQVNPFEKA